MIRAFILLVIGLGVGPPAGAVAAQSAPAPLRPDTVLTPPGGPRAFVLHAPESPIVAVRLHVPLQEAEGEAGAGEILRRMALSRTSAAAERVGARLEGVRTSTGLAYTATGPSADFDHLVWLLREAAAEPGPERFRRARQELGDELEARAETPTGTLAMLLRTRVSPSVPPADGTLASLDALDHARLREIWRRSHERERMTVVVVGSVPPEAVLAALTDLGPSPDEPPVDPSPASEPPPGSGPDPEVLRHWYGEAYAAADLDDPRALVGARLIAERLRTSPGNYEIGIEAWELGGQVVVAVLGAAYPRDAAALRDRIRGLRNEMRTEVTEEAVERAKARLKRDILSGSRTPWGLADFVGQRLEADDDVGAAQRYMERLESLGPGDMEALFEGLEGAPEGTAEVTP